MLVSASPQPKRHALAIEELANALALHHPGVHRVRTQLPLTFASDESEPEPDLAVVPAGASRRSARHPDRALLVVEVASDSLAKDRGPKARLYARALVPEYWIVNLVDELVAR